MGTDLNYEYGVYSSGCTTTQILEQANTNDKYKNIKEGHIRKGCHCIPSRDIGAYNTCLNKCKYCHANKKPQLSVEIIKHDPNRPLLIEKLKKTDVIANAKQRSFIIKK